MEALQIQYWPTDRLREYARNPRKNDHVIDKIVASISEFGFVIPILARSDGQVIDGHLRLKGARKLVMTEVPVIVCDHWTEAQVKAFRLLANRSAAWADWDNELLAVEIGELKTLDFDLSITGFEVGEIARLDINDAAEPVEGTKESAPEDATESGEESDLMDAHDGADNSGQENIPRLKWGKTVVPITDDEADCLSAEYSAYVEVNGMSFGFVRSIMDRLFRLKSLDQ